MIFFLYLSSSPTMMFWWINVPGFFLRDSNFRVRLDRNDGSELLRAMLLNFSLGNLRPDFSHACALAAQGKRAKTQ
jgi:hypothetical protein